VTLTEKELRHVLEKHNITAIDPLGEKLDPNLHQAMVQIDHPDAEAGTIVQVMQIGYRIHDRLLRAAMVAVAKGNGGGNAAGQQVDTEA
jgi:molecular chaperone GrpE